MSYVYTCQSEAPHLAGAVIHRRVERLEELGASNAGCVASGSIRVGRQQANSSARAGGLSRVAGDPVKTRARDRPTDAQEPARQRAQAIQQPGIGGASLSPGFLRANAGRSARDQHTK
jgi:hypothetical protein